MPGAIFNNVDFSGAKMDALIHASMVQSTRQVETCKKGIPNNER